MRFSVDFGVGAKIFSGKVHPSLELHVFRYLWSRSDAGVLYGENRPNPKIWQL